MGQQTRTHTRNNQSRRIVASFDPEVQAQTNHMLRFLSTAQVFSE